jgi:hypothetical protein
MNTQTLDERIRKIAREKFKARVKEAFSEIHKLNGKSDIVVEGVSMNGTRDVVDKVLLEKLERHIVQKESIRHEEQAVGDFVAEFDEMITGNEQQRDKYT